MGRGNWFPGSSLEDSRVVYLDLLDGLADEERDDDDLLQIRYDDFKYNLHIAAGKSFDWDADRRCLRRLEYCLPRIGRDDVVLCVNSLVALLIDAQGDMSHMGIGFLVREDAPSFAASRLDQLADCVFDRLADSYNLRVRTSAWTSSLRAKPQPKKRRRHEHIQC